MDISEEINIYIQVNVYLDSLQLKDILVYYRKRNRFNSNETERYSSLLQKKKIGINKKHLSVLIFC